MRKKLFALFLLCMCPMVTFASENTYYTNKYQISMTEEQYQNLKEQGFSDFEIEYMTEEEFDKRKDIEATLEATSEQYYKKEIKQDGTVVESIVTEEEYENFDPSMSDVGLYSLVTGYVETTMLKVTTTISEVDSQNYMFKTTMESKLIPTVRHYDIIGIGFSNSSIYAESDTMEQYDTTCYMTSGTCTTASSPYFKVFDTGIGAKYTLDTSLFAETILSRLYYNVRKLSSAGTITQLDAYGWYRHATSDSVTAAQSNTFTVTQNGISFSSSSVDANFDELPAASHARWNGSW